MIPSLAKLALATDTDRPHKRGRPTRYTPCKITLELAETGNGLGKTLSLKFETIYDGGNDPKLELHPGWLWNAKGWEPDGEEVGDAEPVYFGSVPDTLDIIMVRIIKIIQDNNPARKVFLFKWDSRLVSKKIEDDFRNEVFEIGENTVRDIQRHFERMKSQYEEDLIKDDNDMRSLARYEERQRRRQRLS
jgi:hypothetical protein